MNIARSVSSFHALAFCLLSMVSLAANATAVTFDFTGTALFGSGIYASVATGTAVTGTYTIDLAAANPSQSAGVIGSNWESESNGSGPTALVFSTTAQFGGFTYQTVTPSFDSDVTSFVQGFPGVVNEVLPPHYDATETDTVSATPSSQGVIHSSSLLLQSQLGGPEPYTADGLPILPQGIGGISEGTISFDTVGLNPHHGEVEFEITSLTPVPLPPSIWLMLGALGILIASRVNATTLLRPVAG